MEKLEAAKRILKKAAENKTPVYADLYLLNDGSTIEAMIQDAEGSISLEYEDWEELLAWAKNEAI